MADNDGDADDLVQNPFDHGVAFEDDPNHEPKATDNPLDALKPYKPRETVDHPVFTITGPLPRS